MGSAGSLFVVLAACSTSMNSNLSLTDDPWQSTLRLFSGTDSPAQAASASPQLCQLRPFRNSQRRLRAGMLSPIGVNPVSKRPLDNAELLGDLGDRTGRLDHQLHGLLAELRRVAFLRSSQLDSLSDDPNLSGVAVRKARGTSEGGGGRATSAAVL